MSAELPDGVGLRTAAVHAGESPDPATNAASPHIVMSTTYVVDQPVPFSAMDRDEGEQPFVYTRWGNPTVRQLERKLAVLEGAEDGRAYASGMAAISALLFSRLSSGDRVVVSDVAYPGTAELARHTLRRMGIEVVLVDTSDLDAVRTALETPAVLVWLETPANPIMRLTDIAAVAELAHERRRRASPSTRPSPPRWPPGRSTSAPTTWSTPSPSTSVVTATPSAAQCWAAQIGWPPSTWRRRSTTAG